MSRWINLDALRSAIAAEAERLAKDAGIETPRVHVRIESPDKRGRRQIEVCVSDTPELDRIAGKNWEDN